jgi:glycine cleavage system H protein
MNNGQRQLDERCVWMDAGVLVYKLCDRGFDCERCPLDRVLRPKEDATDPMFDFRGGGTRIRMPLPSGLDEDTQRLLRAHSEAAVPEELLYSSDHLWVRVQDERLALIGLDDLFAPLVPRSARIILASPGTRVERGQPFGWVYLQERVLPLPSPITGVVLRQNEQILTDPVLLSSNAYDFGWLLMLRPECLAAERPLLLTATDMQPLMQSSIADVLQRAGRRLSQRAMPEGFCMNDGGTPVASLYEALGEKSWAEILRTAVLPRSERNRDALP